MSRPSEAHEVRVDLLRTVASLAGYPRGLPLGLHVVPDVVRFDSTRRRVFVGDAKETESPGNLLTARRLRAYAGALRPLLAAGWDAVFVVCHGTLYRADPWCAVLTEAVRTAGLVPSFAGSNVIDRDAVLAWVSLFGISQRRGGPAGSVSSRPWPGSPVIVVDPCGRSTSSAVLAA